MNLLVKHAIRRLCQAPGFTVLSVLMLALGVAMSTSTFSITNSALLRPLPFHDPDELVRITTISPKDFSPMVSPGNAMDLRDQLGEVGEFALFSTGSEENVAEPGHAPELQIGMSVSANALKILGVQPALGRGFQADEDRPNRPQVMLLTDRYWRDHYNSDPGVLGKVLRVGTDNFTIIGVLPHHFDEPLLWYGCKYVSLMTVWPGWRNERAAKWMSVMGRLRSGVSIGKAQVRVSAFAQQLSHDHPVEMGADTLRVSALGSSFVAPQIRIIYWLVVGLAVFVLMIACANLGAVQLVRAFGRHNELAVRAAVGATRLDLIAALAMESFFVVVAGAGLGLLLTYWTRSVVGRWLDGQVLTVDIRVVLFAVLAGLLATVCFGVVPAWMTTGSVAQALKETSRGSTSGRGQTWLKYLLIVGQIGLALVLVSTAASFVLGVRAFVNRDRGWQPEGLVSGAFNVPWAWIQKEQKDPRLVRQVIEKLRAIPGVQRVGISSNVVVYGDLDSQPLYIEGAPVAQPGREPRASIGSVDADFLSVVGVRLHEGRLFTPEWRSSDPSVAIVSATTARLLWPNLSAVGRRVRFGQETAWHEIVGVVSDATFSVGYDTPGVPLLFYRPIQETNGLWYCFILKTQLPASSLENSIRATFDQIDPDIKVVQIGDLPKVLAEFASTGPLTGILITFAAAGLVIAMVGLYGVLSQYTAQRRREIGVRIALGASRGHIVGMMLAYGARLLLIGGVVGVAGSYAVAVLFRQALHEFPMLGLLGDIIIGLALAGVGLAACYLPSWRAARVDPVKVLGAE